MINIAICDDEPYYTNQIKEIISDYLDEKQLGYCIQVFSSGEDLAKLEEQMGQFQIVYLDINMDGLDGIETAKRLRRWCEKTFVVFVTAFINYTLEGYKVEAIRYILKDKENLKANIEESIDAILDKYELSNHIYEMAFKNAIKQFSEEQFVYAESTLHDIMVFLLEKGEIHRYCKTMKLDQFQEMMNSDRLLRIQKSFLVNMKYIQRIEAYQITLYNGRILPVSRNRYAEVKEKIIMFEGEF